MNKLLSAANDRRPGDDITLTARHITLASRNTDVPDVGMRAPLNLNPIHCS